MTHPSSLPQFLRSLMNGPGAMPDGMVIMRGGPCGPDCDCGAGKMTVIELPVLIASDQHPDFDALRSAITGTVENIEAICKSVPEITDNELDQAVSDLKGTLAQIPRSMVAVTEWRGWELAQKILDDLKSDLPQAVQYESNLHATLAKIEDALKGIKSITSFENLASLTPTENTLTLRLIEGNAQDSAELARRILTQHLGAIQETTIDFLRERGFKVERSADREFWEVSRDGTIVAQLPTAESALNRLADDQDSDESDGTTAPERRTRQPATA